MTVEVAYNRGEVVIVDKHEGVKQPTIAAQMFVQINDLNGRLVAQYPLGLVVKLSYLDNIVTGAN